MGRGCYNAPAFRIPVTPWNREASASVSQNGFRTTQEQIPTGGGDQRVRCLRVLFPESVAPSPTVFPLVRQDVHIGRGDLPPPHLSFDDPKLSRLHATVRFHGAEGCHVVADQGSTNGTRRNGAPIAHATLAPGDVVRVGDTLLLYDSIGWEAPAARDAGKSGVGESGVGESGVGESGVGESGMIGTSRALRDVVGRIGRAAKSDLAVLVLGESGTGKELVAREVHRRSGRQGPFLAVNCGAIASTLIESELFGHVRGAFTGATSATPGLFRAADGGTLFLDEIGDLTPELQTRLLRVVETGEVRPVGGTTATRADVRIVAATNLDLAAAVDDGRFRGDLFARLDELRLELPPLRSRREDVLPLVRHFAELHGAGRRLVLDPDAAEALVVHPWRFNVRELEKVVRLVLVEHPDVERVTLDLLPAAVRASVRADRDPDGASLLSLDPEGFRSRVAAQGGPSAEELRDLLFHYQGRVVDIATFLGKDRRQVYRWIERHGLRVDDFRV